MSSAPSTIRSPAEALAFIAAASDYDALCRAVSAWDDAVISPAFPGILMRAATASSSAACVCLL